MYVSDTELVGLVITRIRGYFNDHRQHRRALQRRWGNMLITPYIDEGTGVSAALAAGRTAYDTRVPNWGQNIRDREIHLQYMDLTDEIKNRVDAL